MFKAGDLVVVSATWEELSHNDDAVARARGCTRHTTCNSEGDMAEHSGKSFTVTTVFSSGGVRLEGAGVDYWTWCECQLTLASKLPSLDWPEQ